MSTQFIDRMAVEVQGEGDAVLCLHGLGGTSNTFTPVLGALSPFKLVRMDLPGSGRSHRVEGALSIQTFVDATFKVAARLHIERFHLLGHSMGAIVALQCAAQQPARIKSLALFGPLLAPPAQAREGIRARAAKARSEGVAGMAEIADAIVAGATSADTRTRLPLAVAAVRESLMRQDPEGYARCCEALADAQAAALENIAAPALLVTGEDDAVAPPQAVRALHERLAGSRLVVLPRCGHWTTFERPEECERELKSFLQAKRY